MSAELIPWMNVDAEAADPALFRQGMPWRITTDLNEVCNIQCSYCHIEAIWGAGAKNARTLPPESVGRLLRDADIMQVYDVTLTGGEITTLPNLETYLTEVKALTFTSTQIITNGTLLRGTLPRELKDAGLSRVSISVDSKMESHDKARGAGTWKRAWTGLQNTLEAGITTNVISVLGMHNIDDWHELPAQLKEMGVRTQNVSLMCRLGRAETADVWMGVPADRFEEVRQKARDLQQELNDDNFMMSFNDGVTRKPGWSGTPTPLHEFQDQNPGIELVVKVDGRIIRNRLYGAGMSIGNITTQSLVEVWQSDIDRRSKMADVVGRDNVGSLPDLYYHYTDSPESMPSEATPSGFTADAVRVRQEPWGVSVFDPATFSVTGLYVRDKV